MTKLCPKCLCRVVTFHDIHIPEEILRNDPNCGKCLGVCIPPIPEFELGLTYDD